MRTVTCSAEFKRDTIAQLLGSKKRASRICRERG
jgi:hypothetical protein